MVGVSLSERLAALTNPVPLQEVEGVEEDSVTGAKVCQDFEGEEFPIISEPSLLRVRAARGLEGEERYRGKKSSRRQLDQDMLEHQGAELGHMFDFGEEGGEDEEEEEYEEEMEDEEMGDKGSFEFDSKTDFSAYGGMSSENDSGGESDDSEEDEEDSEEVGDSENDETMEVSNETVSDIVTIPMSDTDPYEKGCAVVGQLASWDKLLEQHILLHKMVSKVNTFPDTLNSFVDREDRDHCDRVKKAEKSLKTLLLKTGDLKKGLERRSLEESSVVQVPSGKMSLADLGTWLEDLHREASPGRRESLALWGDRTRKVGAAWDSLHTSALEQVDQIMANRQRLVNRTRVRRSEYRVLGSAQVEGETNNSNIFDDSDFYHQLLRELIERKTAGSGQDGSTGRQWLQIQKLRSKLKKKVDTRASKGRKIRYDVHSKLVNFMAPVVRKGNMEEAAKNELFSSLFGARKAST